MWELWLVEGLSDDRFALLSKTHHALVDGISGVDIATVLFDTSPDPVAGRAAAGRRVDPAAAADRRSAAGRRAAGARDRSRRDRSRRPRRAARPAARRVEGRRRRPRHGRGRPRRTARSAAEPAQRPDRPAPPFHLGPRRPAAVQGDQERARGHRQRRRPGGGRRSAGPATCGGTASSRPRRCCARWCRSRSAPTSSAARWATASPRCGRRCRSASPTRSQRLLTISQEMSGVKESGQAVGAQVLTEMTGFAPPTIMAQAARLQRPPAHVQPRRDQRPRAAAAAVHARPASGARCSRWSRWPPIRRSGSRS